MDEDLLATATIGSTFGLSGDVRIYPNNSDGSYLEGLTEAKLSLPGGAVKQVRILSVKKIGGNLVARFEGFETPEKARLLAKAVVLVPRKDAYPLRDGEVYVGDLIGMKVLFHGDERGTVKSAFEGPQALLLEVVRNDGAKAMVPFMKRFVAGVDVPARTLDLAVDWILA